MYVELLTIAENKAYSSAPTKSSKDLPECAYWSSVESFYSHLPNNLQCCNAVKLPQRWDTLEPKGYYPACQKNRGHQICVLALSGRGNHIGNGLRSCGHHDAVPVLQVDVLYQGGIIAQLLACNIPGASVKPSERDVLAPMCTQKEQPAPAGGFLPTDRKDRQPMKTLLQESRGEKGEKVCQMC